MRGADRAGEGGQGLEADRPGEDAQAHDEGGEDAHRHSYASAIHSERSLDPVPRGQAHLQWSADRHLRPAPGECGPDESHGLKRGLDWDQIVKKEEIDPPEPFVYDLEVEGVHNFVTNGILSHNSQILRYMADMAPRGIYASGKSSSAAGLCVHPDTKIVVDGKSVAIGGFVESKMRAPQQVKPGAWSEACDGHEIGTVWDGPPETRRLKAVWRLNTPPFLVELIAASGHRITLTPETRVKVRRFGMAGAFSRSVDLHEGDEVLVLDGGEMKWVGLNRGREIWNDLPPYVYDLTVDEATPSWRTGSSCITPPRRSRTSSARGDGHLRPERSCSRTRDWPLSMNSTKWRIRTAARCTRPWKVRA